MRKVSNNQRLQENICSIQMFQQTKSICSNEQGGLHAEPVRQKQQEQK